MYIDNMDYHYELPGYPADVSWVKAAVPAGLFIMWCHENGLLSERAASELRVQLQKVKDGLRNAEHLFADHFDGKLSDRALSGEAVRFANHYYHDDLYFRDLEEVFGDNGAFYRIEGDYLAQALISKRIQIRYRDWRRRQR